MLFTQLQCIGRDALENFLGMLCNLQEITCLILRNLSVYICFLISHVPPAHSFFENRSILENLLLIWGRLFFHVTIYTNVSGKSFPDNGLYMFYVVRAEVLTRYPDVRCQDDVN